MDSLKIRIPFLFLTIFLLASFCSFGAEESPVPGSVDSSIRVMEQRIKSRPDDYFGNAALGKLYYRKARQTGDIIYYQHAESALRKALEIRPELEDATIDLAAVYTALHRFKEALDQIQPLVRKYPDNAGILAIQADAYLELGDYEKAKDLSNLLAQKFPTDPAVLARQAHLAELMGQPEKAITLIQNALVHAADNGFRVENLAWYHARLADLYFHTGRLTQAEETFRRSLEIYDDYHIALAGLAHVLEANGKIREAIELYERVVQSNESPGAHIAIGDLYKKLPDESKAQQAYSLAENLFTSSPLHRSVYSREMVYFYADQGKNLSMALTIAQQDLQKRKDIGGYDALAWAYFTNGKYAEAETAMQEALKFKTKEPDFYFHAAQIFEASGKKELSAYYAAQAKSLWPYLPE